MNRALTNRPSRTGSAASIPRCFSAGRLIWYPPAPSAQTVLAQHQAAALAGRGARQLHGVGEVADQRLGSQVAQRHQARAASPYLQQAAQQGGREEAGQQRATGRAWEPALQPMRACGGGGVGWQCRTTVAAQTCFHLGQKGTVLRRLLPVCPSA